MAQISQVSCLPLACRGCYCSFSPSLSSMFCKKRHTHTHTSVCFIFISLRVCLFVCFLTGAAVGDPLCFLFVPHPFIIFYY